MPSGADGRGHGRIRLIGDDLVAVDGLDGPAAQALAARLREDGRWLEAVAGAESVVARFDLAADAARSAKDRLAAAVAAAPEPVAAAGAPIEIPVVYGGEFGPDLGRVCTALGLAEADFIARHTAATHRVEMLGFTPGFAYLVAPDGGFDVPRRDEPRTRVPAGAVGIAGGRTGLYALPGPGGWQIVGRTPERLFEPRAERPFRLSPGSAVRFRAIAAAEFKGPADR